MAGYIHIYCGDGKGKTTAAVGLAVRCAGGGGRVLFSAFLKDNSSGERRILEKTICLLPNPEKVGFFKYMSREEKEEYSAFCDRTMTYIENEAKNFDMIVLDEAVPAVNNGLIPLQRLLAFLDGRPAEIVLTGRDPKKELLDRADYITEMKKLRHPFDNGLEARKFIEM